MTTSTLQGFQTSPQQAWLWSLQQRDGIEAYRTHGIVAIDGLLDLPALRRAIRAVVVDQELLRSRFEILPGMRQPLQIVEEPPAFVWTSVDVSGLPEAERTAFYEACLIGIAFASGRGGAAPLGVCAIKFGPRRHLLRIELPAMHGDAGALAPLQRRIDEAYRRETSGGAGRGQATADGAAQYADVAETLARCLDAEEFESGRELWRARARDASGVRADAPLDAPAEAPIDATVDASVEAPVAARHGFMPRVAPVPLAPAIGDRIAALCADAGVSRRGLLLAAWGSLMCRLADEEAFAIGVSCDGRSHDVLRDIVGPLSRYVPFVCRAGAEASMFELATALDRLLGEADEHQHYFAPGAFTASVEERALERQRVVAFDYQRAEEVAASREPAFTLERVHGCADRCALKLTVFDREHGGLRCEIHYDASLIADHDARRVAAWAAQLLTSWTARLETPAVLIGFLTPDERRDLRRRGEGSAVDLPDASVPEMFTARVAQCPDAIALVMDGQQMSYSCLAQRTAQLAVHLRSRGIGAEARVALCLDRGIDLVVAMLGVLEAGAAYVPLDPEHPIERLRVIATDARVSLVLSHGAAGESLADVAPVLALDSMWPIIAATPRTGDTTRASPDQLAYLLYTSGSTGQPKGVAIARRALANHLLWICEAFGFAPTDTFLQKTPATFDASVSEFYAPLLSGGRLALAGPGEHRDPDRIVARLRQYQATATQFVPSVLAEIVRASGLDECRHLRLVLVGGESLPRDTCRRLLDRLPLRIANLYGPTEVTVDSTAYAFASIDDNRPIETGMPIGRPLTNLRVHVVDRHGMLVPHGRPGELSIGGAGLARGYADRPALTAERFIPDPLGGEPGARVYRSGDRVRWNADGQLIFLGRIDRQVKLRGHRIELGEIEAALARVLGSRQAAVVLREDAPGLPRLVAYLAFDDGTAQPPARCRQLMQASLPEVMIPSAFVVLDRLPLSVSGKIDRLALPAPETDRAESRADVRPREGSEALIAAIWGEVLGRDDITRDASFFELGGHSLLATQVVSRMQQAFATDVPLRMLFEAPTVAELSVRMEQARGGERPVPPPLVAAPRPPQGVPLSFAQQRLWFLEQLSSKSAAYNVPYALRLRGSVDEPALARSLRAIVARHEVLRTRLVADAGIARQQVDATATLSVPIVDLRALPAAPREVITARLVEEEAARPFVFGEAPLLRARLLRRDADDCILLITLPHIVSDGWSTGVVVRELGALYTGFTTGVPAALPPLPVQYADFAVWQREWFSGPVLDQQIDYWRARLAGITPLQLPTDRPRPAAAATRGGLLRFTWDTAFAREITAFSKRERVTPFMTLLAAAAAVFTRWAGQTDVAIGTDVANRHHLATERLIGFFVNQLVLRLRLEEAPTGRALLAQAREVALDAYAHQDLPFEQLVDALRPARDLARPPLFQVKVVLQNLARERLSLPGVTIESLPEAPRPTKFDITLVFDEADEGLYGLVEFAADLWDETTMARLVSQIRRVLEAMIANPDQYLADVPLLSEAERARALRLGETPALSDAAADGETIVSAWLAQAARAPDAIALVHAGHHVTYATAARRAARLAAALRARGVGPDVRVAVCLTRSPALIEAWLGVLQAGAAYVPLDPAQPFARLAFMLEDSGAAVVLMDATTRGRMPSHGVYAIDAAADAAIWNAANDVSANELSSAIDPETLAYVIYTSGSTGVPKGVAVTHRGVPTAAHGIATALGLGPGARMLQFASASFDAAAVEWAAALSTGASLVLASRDELVGDPLAALLQREQVEAMIVTPTVLSLLQPHEAPAIRAVMSAGEACRGPWVARWAARCRLCNGYGPTENTVCTTLSPSLRAVNEPDIGRPLPGMRVYVAESPGEPASVGTPGELWIGGVGLARGYLGQPRLTAERFVPDPFSGAPGARLYRSGDRVRWQPDGTLDFLGRLDHQIKLHGHRIELGEIEAAIEQQAGIRQAAVVLDGDSVERVRLAAYVVSDREGVEVDTAALRASLEARLPAYMMPAVFVRVSALPLTASGKVDRRELAAVPITGETTKGEEGAPRTPAERLLAGIWEQVLQRTSIGVHDNFFELGGDSILSLQIAARASAAGIVFSVQDLFQSPTIAQLATRAEGTIAEADASVALDTTATVAATSAAGATRSTPASTTIPLTPIQHWLFGQSRRRWDTYTQSLWFAVSEPFDGVVLRETCRAIVAAHASLRLRFTQEAGVWTQSERPEQPHADGAHSVTWADITSTPPSARASLLASIGAQTQDALGLHAGPLLRIVYVDGGPGQRRLLLMAHHLVIDGVSWRVLLEDFAAAYDAITRGETPQIRGTTPFAAWSHALAALEARDDVLAERRWWARQARPGPRCPRDMAGEKTASRTHVQRAVSAATTRALLEMAPRVYRCSLYDALLAAIAQTIGAWQGGDEVLVDLESHGRHTERVPGVDLSRTVGWFTSVAPRRLPVIAGGGAAQLEAVVAASREGPRDGLGYGVLRYLRPDGASLHSHAEIVVNYLGQFDAVLGPRSRLTPAVDVTSPPDRDAIDRQYLLEITGAVRGGQLWLDWAYSNAIHTAATIERLADHLVGALDTLVAEAPAAGPRPRAADLPSGDLSVAQRSRLAAKIGRTVS